MRTTVTLDPDVVLLLEKRQRERRVSFKQALNDAVRAGLGDVQQQRQPFRTMTAKLGEPAVDLDRALQLAAELEDEERARKLQRGT